MKHVFTIISHTCFLTALGVKEYLHLSDEDVVFIYMRHYTNEFIDTTVRILDFNELYDKTHGSHFGIKTLLMPWFTKRIERVVDCRIEKEIGEEYSFYTSHLLYVLFNQMATHKLCKKVSLIQEGGFGKFSKGKRTDIIYLKSATIIQYTIKGRFMNR